LGRELRSFLVSYGAGGMQKDAYEEAVAQSLREALPDHPALAGLYRCFCAIESALRSSPGGKVLGQEVLRIVADCGLPNSALSDVICHCGYAQSNRIGGEVLAQLERWIPQWDLMQLKELADIAQRLECSGSGVDEKEYGRLIGRYPWLTREALQAMERCVRSGG